MVYAVHCQNQSAGYVVGLNFREICPFDLDRTKALMKEAGYENGFTVTLDATNIRYINDTQICQALASQFVKINISLKMNIMPMANFFGYIRVLSPKSSLFMSGFDIPSGDGGDLHAVQDYVDMTPRFDNFIYVFDMDSKK